MGEQDAWWQILKLLTQHIYDWVEFACIILINDIQMEMFDGSLLLIINNNQLIIIITIILIIIITVA